MSRPVEFLNALSHACATFGLYGPEHPARGRAVEELEAALHPLFQRMSDPVFCFLDDEVIYGERPLLELKSWTLGQRLSDHGIQRVEFRPGVDRSELESFLQQVTARLERNPDDQAARPTRLDHIRFGPVNVGDDLDFDLKQTMDAVADLYEEVKGRRKVDVALARAVVQTLAGVMRYGQKLLLPLASLNQIDQYSTVHSINASVLAMGLAEFLRFGAPDVRAIGEAALLHDIGKTLTPEEILRKPERLTPEEWAVVQRHPIEGARILLQSDERLELAAVVAYEHHIGWKGNRGYPRLHYRRRLHPVSRLIQICDVYDACRTRRPFRDPIPTDAVLNHIQTSAGQRFDPALVMAFAKMIREWGSRTIRVDENGSAVAEGHSREASRPNTFMA